MRTRSWKAIPTPNEAVNDDDEDAQQAKAQRTAESTVELRSQLSRFKHLNNADQDPSLSQASSHLSASPPPAPSPAKRRRKRSSKYAPPSKYAHLSPLTDTLAPGLIAVFVGTNPGVRTAAAGHAYAHPSNLFWKLLYSSGCTDALLRPEQDGELPGRFALGNTNIVARPSRDAAELSRRELAAGAAALDAKIARFRPEAVCLVGKGIWEAVWRWRHGRELRREEFRYGWQGPGERMGGGRGSRRGRGRRNDGDDDDDDDDAGDGWEGAWVFVATSTSGLSASTKRHEKAAIMRPFGEWVCRRRAERARLLAGERAASGGSGAS